MRLIIACPSITVSSQPINKKKNVNRYFEIEIKIRVNKSYNFYLITPTHSTRFKLEKVGSGQVIELHDFCLRSDCSALFKLGPGQVIESHEFLSSFRRYSFH